MFQKSIAVVILLVVAICWTGCSSITQKRKASDQTPEIVEEDIGEPKKSQRGERAQQDEFTDSSRQGHRNDPDNSRLETPSQDLPEGTDSATIEPEQQAPRRLIWKGSQGGGQRWAPGDRENSQ